MNEAKERFDAASRALDPLQLVAIEMYELKPYDPEAPLFKGHEYYTCTGKYSKCETEEIDKYALRCLERDLEVHAMERRYPDLNDDRVQHQLKDAWVKCPGCVQDIEGFKCTPFRLKTFCRTTIVNTFWLVKDIESNTVVTVILQEELDPKNAEPSGLWRTSVNDFGRCIKYRDCVDMTKVFKAENNE